MHNTLHYPEHNEDWLLCWLAVSDIKSEIKTGSENLSFYTIKGYYDFGESAVVSQLADTCGCYG